MFSNQNHYRIHEQVSEKATYSSEKFRKFSVPEKAAITLCGWAFSSLQMKRLEVARATMAQASERGGGGGGGQPRGNFSNWLVGHAWMSGQSPVHPYRCTLFKYLFQERWVEAPIPQDLKDWEHSKSWRQTGVQLAAFMTQLMVFKLFYYKQGNLISSQGLWLVLEVMFLTDFVKRWGTAKAANSDMEHLARGWVVVKTDIFHKRELSGRNFGNITKN